MPQNDMIFNWKNTLRKTTEGLRHVAAQVATSHRAAGFSVSEALDLMIADNFEIDVAKEALAQIYDSESPVIKKASKKRSKIFIY